MINSRQFEIPSRLRMVLLLVVCAGTGAALFGLRWDPKRTWPNLLLNGFYMTSLGLSAMVFLTTQRAAGAQRAGSKTDW